MGKCNTLDSKWSSEVNGSSDGDLSIEEEGGDGSFKGKHEKSKNDLNGKCREPHGKPHSIWFVVPKNDHLYFGVFVSNKRIEGVRLKLSSITNFEANFDGDDEWVGTKT